MSSGASLAAFLAIQLGVDQSWLGQSGVGLAALAGAAVTVLLVWRLARFGSELPPATLLLAGVTIALFCSAASMLVQYMAGFGETQRMMRWLMGGLDGLLFPRAGRARRRRWRSAWPCCSPSARDLNALSAGGDAAASVGVSPARATGMAFATASLLVGAAIALAGPIGFVGLLVPHATRALVGPDHRVLLPCSMLGGAALLVLCDTVSRIALAPVGAAGRRGDRAPGRAVLPLPPPAREDARPALGRVAPDLGTARGYAGARCAPAWPFPSSSSPRAAAPRPPAIPRHPARRRRAGSSSP